MLRISTKLSLPDDTVTSTLVVYGAKGMGKSHFGRALAESLYDNDNRFCFLDPVGANWGLRFGKTKDKIGLEVLILGGVHGDIPIEPTGGAVVADLVADESISTVIDISRHPSGKMWSKGEKIRFVTDFCSKLYERQGERRDPLMLIIDEAGRYVPQNPSRGDLEITKCIGAIEELVELGRNVAIGVTLITQRSARMNKSVSELADCMVAFRTIGPNSVDAILGWLGEHIPKERWKTILSELRTLPRGSALVVSPGWLEHEGVVQIRDTRTFDSSETPKGAERRAQPGKSKKPNLDKYLERMRETVERAKEHDPRALKARIAELEKQLKKDQTPPPALRSQVAKPIFDKKGFESIRQRFDTGVNELRRLLREGELLVDGFDSILGGEMISYAEKCQSAEALGERGVSRVNDRRTIPSPAPAPETVRSQPHPTRLPRTTNGDSKLGKCAATLLAVLARHYPKPISKNQLAVQSGYSATSSTMANGLTELRVHGYLDGSGQALAATSIGSAIGPEADVLPTGEGLIDYWRSKLGKCPAELLGVLIDAYPKELTKEEIEKLSPSKYSATSSTMANGLTDLRKASLIEGRGALKVSRWLMEEDEDQ